MLVFLNGQFLQREEARISAFDAGLQHAVGLFETMLVRHGRAHFGERHMQRLRQSARQLGLSDSLRTGPLLEAIELTARRNELERARVRLTVTGGDLSMLQRSDRREVDPTILIVAQPPTAYPEKLFEEGALVLVADAKVNPFDPFAGHKTLSYWPRLRALQQAAARGGDESLWFTVTNRLAGGCVSNCFLVKDGRLATPTVRGEEDTGAPPSPVLPGVARAAIIDLAEEAGLSVERRELTIDDVLTADEMFLTNSSWGVLPVRQVEGHIVGDGRPGPVTRRLLEAWGQTLEETA